MPRRRSPAAFDRVESQGRGWQMGTINEPGTPSKRFHARISAAYGRRKAPRWCALARGDRVPGYVKFRKSDHTQGEMAEWLKAHAWKACLGETLTWVRIPLSPPANPLSYNSLGKCRSRLITAQIADKAESCPPGPEGPMILERLCTGLSPHPSERGVNRQAKRFRNGCRSALPLSCG
jgi:hypothetical protein